MTENKTTLEIIAPTIEEAIQKGLDELGLSRDNVDVEILDEGKRNLFRFASRQARIKLLVKDQKKENKSKNKSSELVPEPSRIDLTPKKNNSDQELVELIVKELLVKMGVNAAVSSEIIAQSDDEKEVISVNIEGDDLSFLIGRKSETLNSLQFITSLIVNHKLNRWVPIQLDVQKFRSRRENELKKLAKRMADQVSQTGRRQYLEPMSANDRRIVHIALCDHDHVYTESFGVEPNRKIGIFPKK